MKYLIKITDKATGEVRVCPSEITEGEWDDSMEFMWTEGNYSCDCNRGLFFNNWEGENDPCGEEKYSCIAVFEDGTEIKLEY